MSLDDEGRKKHFFFQLHDPLHHSASIHKSSPVFFHSTLLSPYVALTLMSLFLDHMSFSFPLYPTLPPSVLPLCGEMKWSVSWVYHPSSCCLPTATLFPSCVSAFLSPFPFASFCHSHRPFLFCHLSLYHVYSSLFLSHWIHSISAATLSFISPPDRPVRKIQPLVHMQSGVVLSACVCVRILHTMST